MSGPNAALAWELADDGKYCSGLRSADWIGGSREGREAVITDTGHVRHHLEDSQRGVVRTHMVGTDKSEKTTSMRLFLSETVEHHWIRAEALRKNSATWLDWRYRAA